jgi:WD40 repeat protein
MMLFAAGGLGFALLPLSAANCPTISPPTVRAVRAAPAPNVDWRQGAAATTDHLPEGAIARLGSSRLRHSWQVTGLSFSADGKLLASCGEEGSRSPSIRIWEVPSGRELRTIRPRNGTVVRVGLSPDGKLVAWSCRNEEAVSVADVVTGRTLGRWQAPLGARPFPPRGELAPAFTFGPRGETLLTADADGKLRLWDLSTGGETLWAEAVAVEQCLFSPDGRILAVLSGGLGGLRLLNAVPGDANAGKPLAFPRVRPAPHCVAFSPDGDLLAGGDDHMVRVWNVATGKEVHRLAWEDHSVFAVGFSRDGKRVAGASAEGRVRTWVAGTGKKDREWSLSFKPADQDTARRLVFSPDLRWLAVAPLEKRIRLVDLITGKEVTPATEQPETGAFVCAWSPSGKLMATPGDANRLLFWEARTGKLLRTGTEQTAGKVYWLTFTADGKQVVTLSYERPTAFPKLAEWDVATGQRVRQVELGLTPGRVVLSPGGRLLACGEPNDVRYRSDPTSTAETVLVDRTTGKVVRRLDDGKVDAPQDLAFSPDGERLASVSTEGTIRLWEVGTGRLLRKMEPGGHEGLSYLLRFLADGRTLLSLSKHYDRGGHIVSRINLWETATGKRRDEYAGPVDLGWCLAVSPDGKLLARSGSPWAGGPDDEVEVWDVLTGRLRQRFKGLRGGPTFLDFAPDSKTLASGSYDDTVLIWDVAGVKKD